MGPDRHEPGTGSITERPSLTSCHRRRHATIRVMGAQQFRAVIAAGLEGRAVIAVPFDPDEIWGAKASHPVGGTIDGRQVRGRLSPDGSGWMLTVTPLWLRDTGVAIGDDVTVELVPEGPHRGGRRAACGGDQTAAALVSAGLLDLLRSLSRLVLSRARS